MLRLVYLKSFSDCKQSDHGKHPCSQFRESKKIEFAIKQKWFA